MTALLLSILFSTLIIIFFRLISNYGIDELETIVWNYLFAAGWGIAIWRDAISPADFLDKPWFGLSLFIGVMYILTFFFLSRSANTAGVAITAVASRISLVIPVLAGFLIFQEAVNALKIIGIILSLVSFYLIFKPRQGIHLNWKRTLLPALLFLGMGTNDTLLKYIQYHFLVNDETLLLTSIFFISLLTGSSILVFRNVKKQESLSYKAFIAGIVLGSLNFGSTYFFIRSMMLFEPAFMFPAVNVGIVSLTTLTGWLFFGEKFSRVNWLGILTAVFAIIIISYG